MPLRAHVLCPGCRISRIAASPRCSVRLHMTIVLLVTDTSGQVGDSGLATICSASKSNFLECNYNKVRIPAIREDIAIVDSGISQKYITIKCITIQYGDRE